jgi:hypothetical protein
MRKTCKSYFLSLPARFHFLKLNCRFNFPSENINLFKNSTRIIFTSKPIHSPSFCFKSISHSIFKYELKQDNHVNSPQLHFSVPTFQFPVSTLFSVDINSTVLTLCSNLKFTSNIQFRHPEFIFKC